MPFVTKYQNFRTGTITFHKGDGAKPKASGEEGGGHRKRPEVLVGSDYPQRALRMVTLGTNTDELERKDGWSVEGGGNWVDFPIDLNFLDESGGKTVSGV